VRTSPAAQLLLAVIAASLVDCGGQVAPPAVTQRAASVRAGVALRAESKHAGDNLLYVSVFRAGEVEILRFKRHAIGGTLTGLEWPGGLCVDKAQDVYVTDTRLDDIFEYRHGALTPFNAFGDPYGSPGACSVDPRNGDLAVVDVEELGGGEYGVVIYRKRNKTIEYYQSSNIYFYAYCTYDGNGDLYLDGTLFTGEWRLAELPAGGKQFIPIAVPSKVSIAGGLEWDGAYLAIGSTDNTLLYRLAVAHSRATLKGVVHLDGNAGFSQFWLTNSRIIVPQGENLSVKYWRYPAGGAATATVNNVGDAIGTAVSLGASAR
jgi:hypothetical protein